MRNFAILLAASAATMVAAPAFAAPIVTGLGAIIVPPTQTVSPSVTFGTNGDNIGSVRVHGLAKQHPGKRELHQLPDRRHR